MSAILELDERRRAVLERMAQQRNVSARRLLQKAVDEFILRLEDEDLLEEASRVAQRSGLREKDAVRIVKEWRSSRRSRK